MPDSTSHYSAQATIKVDGSDLGEKYRTALTSVRVEQSVHVPDAFTLRFDDAEFKLLDEMRLTPGTKVEIGFTTDRGPVVLTRAEVTAISVEQGPTGRHEMVVTGMDATHRLARQAKTRSYQQMTDADIVDQIARDYGLDTEVDPTRNVHEYVLQSSESDLAFLKGRASLLGFDVWIAENKLHFKQAPSSATTAPTLTWRENLTKFKVRFSSAERCDEVTVRAWDPVAKRAIIGSAQSGDTGTTAPLAQQLSDAARQGFGQVRRFAGQVPVQTQAEADALAASLLLKASGEEVIARGETIGNPLVTAGATVKVEGMGERLSGEYRITSAEHIYATSSPYITRFVCGGKEPASLVDLLGGAGGSGGMKRGWGSLVVGVVTNNDDPEKLGRVRVKFPSLSENDESAWARVVVPGGGAKRGLCLLPEVGDEVLLGFEHDKKERPVVLGGLWNRDDAPPREFLERGDVRYRSWTSRNGHVIEFDDGDDPSITLSLAGGDCQLVLKKGATVLKDQQSVKFEGQTMKFEGQSLEIKASGTLKLSAPSIEVAADGDLTLKGAIVKIN